MIYVCDKCLQASCWAGIFMCAEAKNAGLFRAMKSDLRKLGREHECYMDREEVRAPRSDKQTPMIPRKLLELAKK